MVSLGVSGRHRIAFLITTNQQHLVENILQARQLETRFLGCCYLSKILGNHIEAVVCTGQCFEKVFVSFSSSHLRSSTYNKKNCEKWLKLRICIRSISSIRSGEHNGHCGTCVSINFVFSIAHITVGIVQASCVIRMFAQKMNSRQFNSRRTIGTDENKVKKNCFSNFTICWLETIQRHRATLQFQLS